MDKEKMDNLYAMMAMLDMLRGAISPSTSKDVNMFEAGKPDPALIEEFTRFDFDAPDALEKLEKRFPVCKVTSQGTIALREDRQKTPYNKTIGWTIPSREMISTIAQVADNKTVVDVGAGSGLISMLLRRLQVRAQPVEVDTKEPKPLRVFMKPTIVDSGYKVPADAVLLISWGRDHMDKYITDYVSAGGKTVIIIGEKHNGCTLACDYLRNSAGWTARIVEIPNFEWIYTYMYVWTRN